MAGEGGKAVHPVLTDPSIGAAVDTNSAVWD
jgi:hypothetical protein